MYKNFTDKELENILKQQNNEEFKPFFSTRVLSKIEKYENIPVFGVLVANKFLLKQYLYAACIIFMLVLCLSIYQDGTISLEHLIGLGNFNEEDILNYTNPVI